MRKAMAQKKINERCPLQSECEKTCTVTGHELDCDYYHDFARPGYEIEDQESIRFKREDKAMMAAYEASVVDDDEDDPDDVESPGEAEKAAVMPSDASDEVIPVPAVVIPERALPMSLSETTAEIRKAMYDAASSFVYIGFLLWRVQESKDYLSRDYSSVYEYAERELGFKKSSTKNFIAINREFGVQGVWNEYEKTYLGVRTGELQVTYQCFNYSQLCEMLSMSDAQRKKITPDMTVKQIREIKREEAEPDLPPDMETIPIPLSDDPEPSGQTSGQQFSSRIHTVNNIWTELPSNLVKSLVAVSNLRYNPKSCYDITIKLHPKD